MPNPENIAGQGFHTNPERINKTGQNKGSKWFKTRLKEFVEKGDLGDKVLEALIKKALTGDVNAQREIMDRVDGKVAQEVDQKTEHSGGYRIEIIDTADQVRKADGTNGANIQEEP